jgi:DNA-binding IclR family transcriptional regulator
MATPQQTGSQAVERASALLSVIVESGAPRTFSSLVAELGLAKSTTSRLLQALERSRLVHRDRAGAFRPGALFSLHAARPSALHDLSELARPTMEHLSQLSRETVNLAVPRGSQVVTIDQLDSQYLVGATNWVGVDVPAHCTALGKVLAAYGVLPLPAAVAAPVRAVDGTVIAAVSISGPTGRINDYGITKIGDLLVSELRGLSALLGHQPRKEGVG